MYFNIFLLTLIIIFIFIFFIKSPTNSENYFKIIEVQKGSSCSEVAKKLKKAKLIKNSTIFCIFAKIKNYSQLIKPGEYKFSTKMSPEFILNKLIKGDTAAEKTFIIPEGLNIEQIATLITKNNFKKKIKFIQISTDLKILLAFKLPGLTVEGYLFPKTYNLTSSMNIKNIIALMLDEFWNNINPEMIINSHKLGLDIHQMITLASLIEKEAKIKEEKKFISAVFHNRLKKNMFLQCDPSSVYGFKNYTGKVTKNSINKKYIYNTYAFAGLPPGPITNPGIDSIIAAINPAKVNYLYFVSKKDGTHNFSTTLNDHVLFIKKIYYNQV